MYILGVDGGGTKTKVSLITDLGVYIGSAISGPSSIDTVSSEISLKNIQDGLQQILRENDIEDIRISSVFAGLGGISSEEDKSLVNSYLHKIKNCTRETVIHSENDIYNAFAGGTMGKPSIAIVIGTGSVAFGIDEEENSFRSGGYSYKEGDPGSSYDLGRKTLKTLAKVLDNRYPTSLFIEEVKKELSVHTFSEAVKMFDEFYEDRTLTASLSKLVTLHADMGDIHALKIVEEATDDLALMVQAVNNSINLSNKELAIIGSLGNANTIFKKKFIEKVLKIDKTFIIHESLLDPSIGACILGLKNVDIVLSDEKLNKLKKI